MEDGVDAVRKKRKWVLGREEPDESHNCDKIFGLARRTLGSSIQVCGKHTQVLDVLIGQEANNATWHLVASLGSSSLGLVNDDAVRDGGGEERGAVGELCHAAVIIHAQPGEPISDGGQNERHMPRRKNGQSAISVWLEF